jgi:hypothetical protein
MEELDTSVYGRIFDFAYEQKKRGKDAELSRKFFMEVARSEPNPAEHRAVLKVIYGDHKVKEKGGFVRLRGNTQKLRRGINRELAAVYGSGAVCIDNLHSGAWNLVTSDEFRQMLNGKSERDLDIRLRAWQEERGSSKRVKGNRRRSRIPAIEGQVPRVTNSELIQRFHPDRHGIVMQIHEEYAIELDATTREAWTIVNDDRRSKGLIPYYASTRFRVIHPPIVRDNEIVLDLAPIDYACFIMAEDPGVPCAVRDYIKERLRSIADRMPEPFRTSHRTLNAYNPVPLGVHSVIIAKDRKTLLRKRGMSVAVSQEAWGVAVGGYCGNGDKVKGRLNVGLTAGNELEKEVGILKADRRDMLFTGFHRNTSTRTTNILGFWRLEADVDELVSVLTDEYPGDGKVFETTHSVAEDFAYEFENIVVDFAGREIAEALLKAGSSVFEMVPECLVALMLALAADGQSVSELLD